MRTTALAYGMLPRIAPRPLTIARNDAGTRLGRYARDVALFAAAPFVALGYVLAFPFVGLALLAWVALRREPVAG
ncbi:MAG TPA: hypothetical protein VFK48_05050 [Usitatibacter sp.]|nr:hypothetical protein [Usitatibacter sp.]